MKWMLALLFVLVPNIVFGQDTGGLVKCSGPDCNLCTLVTMTNEILQWVMGVLISLAVLGLMYAGIKLVTSGGDTSAWTSAKNMFTNIIIGFVIVLSAWLIVDTLLKMVLTDEIQTKYGPWHQIDGAQCGGINEPSETATTGVARQYCFSIHSSEIYCEATLTMCEATRLQKMDDRNISYAPPCALERR